MAQIVNGVADAQALVADSGAAINLAIAVHVGSESGMLGKVADGVHAYPVDFDIAVTSGEGTEAGGSAGIRVIPILTKVQGKAQWSEQATSRVRFSVPISLPVDVRTKQELERGIQNRARNVKNIARNLAGGNNTWLGHDGLGLGHN